MKNPLLGDSELPRIDFAHEVVPGLVSVVIPAWKAGTHIAATLRTLGRQSYTDWELVVVEDGSADATRRIVASFAAEFPRHRVVYLRHDRSLGPSAARNTGFAEARGQFIALLDADDHWLPDHLAESVGCLEQERTDIAYSSVILSDHASGMPFGVWGPTTHELANFPGNLLNRNSVVPSATVLRRHVLEDVGGWHPGLRYAEDVFYWLSCARAGKTFSYLPGVRCIYTKNRSGSATQRLAQTMTSFAWVVESFLVDAVDRPVPMSDRAAARRVAGAYHTAALTHLNGSRHGDPSADPRLAYACASKAWQAKPMRFRYPRLMLWAVARAAMTGRLGEPRSQPEAVPGLEASRKRAAA
jgi:GT2 family glycosyltransferase